MAKLLDDSWKNWVRENVGLGIPHQIIFNTLTNNDFNLDEITKIMSEMAPSLTKAPAGEQIKATRTNTIYNKKELKHERRFIHNAEKIEVEDDVLDIYKIDNFLSNKECEDLIEIIRSNRRKSKVSFSNQPEGYIDDKVRTSSTCDLSNSLGAPTVKLNERINAHMGIHELFGEILQGQHYEETQEFKSHTDTFAPNSEEFEKFAKTTGQRTWTFMIYLNELEDGGETKFTKVKTSGGKELSFRPEKGLAVTWNNLYVNGDINNYSMHQGCPVKKGEKIIITKWFRERRA